MNETANANPKLKLQRMAKRAMSTPQDAAAAAAEKKPRTDHALSHADDSASSVSELPAVALRDSVRLTPSEAQLFEFLLAVEKHNECDAVLRVAGGWVRDKLLGRDSDDVDIALDTLKGRAFADLVNSYERDHGHVEHAVGVIKANPEQSKHLETATMQLGDPPRWVDFVNLRAETYSADADHRIPTDVQFGSPTQDAERRDFTINALFYNIGEQKVEDFTGRVRYRVWWSSHAPSNALALFVLGQGCRGSATRTHPHAARAARDLPGRPAARAPCRALRRALQVPPR